MSTFPSKNHHTSRSISTIFFDLDNTLIETRKGDSLACRKLSEELCEQYGIPMDLATKMTSNYLKLFRKCPDNPTYSLDIWRTNLWNRALGEKYSYLSKKVYDRWLYLRYKFLKMNSETSFMLQDLRKKYHLGLITNGTSNAQWEKVHKLSLEQYFDIILVSGDLPFEKPNPEIFEEACNFLGSRPESCIMVGDKLETDILGGLEAGLGGTVWIPIVDKPRLSSEDPKPDFVIKEITELLKILNREPGVPDLEDSSSNTSDGS